LPTSTHAHQHRPTFKFASSVEIKRTFVEYPAALAWSSSCVSTRMSSTAKNVAHQETVVAGASSGTRVGKALSSRLRRSCLTGAYRSCDYEQCWFLLAQVVISSRAILRGAFPRAGSKPVSNFSTGFALRQALPSLSLSGSIVLVI